MKKLTLFFLVILGGCTPNTTPKLAIQPNRVLYSSAELDQVSTADSIARIRPGGFLGNTLKFTLRDGERRSIPKKEIWGYSDEKGRVWRCFKKTCYQVLRVSDVVEYEISESRNVGHNIYVYEPVKFYSKTLDSKIVGSRKRALQSTEEEAR